MAKELTESRRTRYTRRAMQDALIELLRNQPLGSITVKALCERADVNRSTFYAHYASIEELLHDIEDETMAWVTTALEQLLAQPDSAGIEHVIERICQYIADNRKHLQVLMSPKADIGFQQQLLGLIYSQRGVGEQLQSSAGSRVTPAFGRGEVIDVNGSPVELLLVKNPMGFRLSLASFDPANADTMIAINDEYADGRDMSWLWDVDFTSLRGTGVKAVSGVRAWDMALRLEYDQVPVESVSTDLEESVVNFVNANSGTPKHIYCTYTAMLKTRAALAKIADVADAGVGK